MMADAKLLTIPSKGQHGLGVDSTDIWNVGPYVWTDGGNFTNQALTTATGYMNGSAHRRRCPDAREPVQGRGHRQRLRRRFRGDQRRDGFPKGEYAMYIDGPWAPTTYKAGKFTGYGTSLIPAGPGGSVSVVGGEDLVIAKGGKHLADTIKFVQFLQSPFAQLAMADAGRHGGVQDGLRTPRHREPGPQASSPRSC